MKLTCYVALFLHLIEHIKHILLWGFVYQIKKNRRKNLNKIVTSHIFKKQRVDKNKKIEWFYDLLLSENDDGFALNCFFFCCSKNASPPLRFLIVDQTMSFNGKPNLKCICFVFFFLVFPRFECRNKCGYEWFEPRENNQFYFLFFLCAR